MNTFKCQGCEALKSEDEKRTVTLTNEASVVLDSVTVCADCVVGVAVTGRAANQLTY